MPTAGSTIGLAAVLFGLFSPATFWGQISAPAGNLQFSNILVLNGAQAAVNRLGTWAEDGGDLVALDRRGSFDDVFGVPQPGIYKIEFAGMQGLLGSPVTNFTLVLTLDGQLLGNYVLSAAPGSVGRLDCITPFISDGQHVLHVLWDNASSQSSLRLKKISIQSAAGALGSGQAWVQQRLQNQSGMDITAPSLSSLTSPACVEGRDPYLNFMQIQAEDSENGTNAIIPIPEPNDRWYANVPLAPDTPTTLEVSYQNGGLTETRNITWTPVNLLNASDLVIRQGDSLLLAARTGSADGGQMSFTVGTNNLPAQTLPLPYEFDTPGTYVVAGSYIPAQGTVRSGSINVTVVSSTLTSCLTPDAWALHPRNWDVAQVPAQAAFQADTRTAVSAVATLTNQVQRLSLQADSNDPRYVLWRLGTNGAVLASTAVNCFQFWDADDTYCKLLTNYPDGSQLVEIMLILSPVPADLTAQLSVTAGGITFADGTTKKTLTSANFDGLGQTKVGFIRAASATTSVCHSITLLQGAAQVGYVP